MSFLRQGLRNHPILVANCYVYRKERRLCTLNVRAKAYSTISLWMTTLKSHQFVRPTGNGPDQEQELVNCISYDIAEKKATFELKSPLQMATQVASELLRVKDMVNLNIMITSNPQKNMSKRAMRKLVNAQLGRSTLALHAPGAKNTNEKWNSLGNRMSLEALNCLRVLLYSCGTFLKTSTYHNISSFLLPLIVELHRSQFGTKTESSYRLSLYQCVEALHMGCKSSVTPPTQYCLHLYGMGLQDRDNEVADFCNRAMVAMRSSLQGVPPTFFLEGSQHDIRNQLKITGQKREQSEEYHVEKVKSRRISSLNPTPLEIPCNCAISIASSDEETQFIKKSKEYTSEKNKDDKPLNDNELLLFETAHEKHSQMEDTTCKEQTRCDRYTAPKSLPEISFNKLETTVSILVPIISSKQETILIDDDCNKPVKILLSPGKSYSCGDQISDDLNISCAQVAHSDQESQKKLRNNSQAEKKNQFESEVMTANLSIDDMMADFVDVVA